MWSALRDAANKIGDDVAGALDSLTDTDTPLFPDVLRPSETPSPQADAVPPAAKSDDAADPEASSQQQSTSSTPLAATPTAATPSGQARAGDAPASEGDIEAIEKAAEKAAESVAKWLSVGVDEVSKALHKVEETVEKGVGAFNEFVEAKKHEAVQGDESELIAVIDAVDSLEAQTDSSTAKGQLDADWERISAALVEQLAALNTFVKAAESGELKEVAAKQISRIEGLLRQGDDATAAATPREADAVATPVPAEKPAAAVERTLSEADLFPGPALAAPTAQPEDEAVDAPHPRQPSGSSQSQSELAVLTAAVAEGSPSSGPASDDVHAHVDANLGVVPATPTPTQEVLEGPTPIVGPPSAKKEDAAPTPQKKATDNAFEWNEEW